MLFLSAQFTHINELNINEAILFSIWDYDTSDFYQGKCSITFINIIKNELYQVLTCSTLYSVNNFGLRWLYMSFKREQIEMIGLWAKKVKCILYLIK